MKEEKKNRKKDSKIISFEMNDEIFMDPHIDEVVKKSLIQEADELADELNADPKLRGVGASDDLLLSIVGKLKEQGIWEEESGGSGSSADGVQDAAGAVFEMEKKKEGSRAASELTRDEISGEPGTVLDGGRSEVRGESGIALNGAREKGNVEPGTVLDGQQDEEDVEPEAVLDRSQGETGGESDAALGTSHGDNGGRADTFLKKAQCRAGEASDNALKNTQLEKVRNSEAVSEKIQSMTSGESDIASGKVQYLKDGESEPELDQAQCGTGRAPEAESDEAQLETNRERDMALGNSRREIADNTSAGQAAARIEANEEAGSELSVSLEELYAMLPETDRRAMELGRKMEQRKQRRDAGRRSRRKALRYGGTAAAVLAVVFGFSMTSEANRRLMQRAWDVVAANFNFNVQTDYLGDKEQVRSKSKEEVEAMEDISNSMGVSAISLEVIPRGMEYYNYEIIMDTMEAAIFYTYEDTIFSVTMINLNTESSSYYMMDESAVFLETITTEQELEAKIWETNQMLDEAYRAYIAEIDYGDCRYILNGMLSLEQMEKIVKNSFIL